MNCVWRFGHVASGIHNRFLNLRRFLSSDNTRYFVENLKQRGVLSICAKDSADYLQGLLTNDMRHFEDGARSIYAAMLNNRGRVLFDLIIYKGKEDDTYYIEADTAGLTKLQSLLKIYSVRRKIEIKDISKSTHVFSVRKILLDDLENNVYTQPAVLCDCDNENALSKLDLPVNETEFIAASRDPRLKELGWRVLSADSNMTSLLPGSKSDDSYNQIRYYLGLAEGMDEIPSGNCIPLEYNFDYLHGISFHKGCYIGQELTARTHHTGVVRKRIVPVTLSSDVTDDANIVNDSGKKLGRLRGVEGRRGLALLRLSDCLNGQKLMLEGTDCEIVARKPLWWPVEVSKESITKES